MDSENKSIDLYGRPFVPFILASEIQQRVTTIGAALREKFADKKPVFVVMLKGAFIFAADLLRASGLQAQVDMVRTRSYQGTSNTGTIEFLLAPDPNLIAGRDVILVEDIVDSGLTMQAFLPELERHAPASITLVALLHKPAAAQVPIEPDLTGFTIPPHFVVGYGLDYNGLGRGLPDLYQLAETA